ncbi:MAG: hypothetical protein ACYDAR_20865 [Thermomicrobiales bacterium]
MDAEPRNLRGVATARLEESIHGYVALREDLHATPEQRARYTATIARLVAELRRRDVRLFRLRCWSGEWRA